MFISTFYDIQNIISKSVHILKLKQYKQNLKTPKNLFKNQTVLFYTFKYRSQSLFYYIISNLFGLEKYIFLIFKLW